MGWQIVYSEPGIDQIKSIYESRGWTFQEKQLSKRCLYFDGWSCTYSCRTVPEAVQTPHSRYSDRINPLRHSKAEDCIGWDVYCRTVAEYTQRVFSFPTDRLNAFRGILSVWEENYTLGFVFGIPTAVFDQALLWRAKQGVDLIRNKSLPSWCWTGWIGGCDYSFYKFHSSGEKKVQRLFEIVALPSSESAVSPSSSPLGSGSCSLKQECLDQTRQACALEENQTNLTTLYIRAVVVNASQFTQTEIFPPLNSPQERRWGVCRIPSEIIGLLSYCSCNDASGGALPADTSLIVLSQFVDSIENETEKSIMQCPPSDLKRPETPSEVNIMLIRWQVGGYAERIAVGTMFPSFWRFWRELEREIKVVELR